MKMYQIKTKGIPIKDEEEDSTIYQGKDSPQSSDCNNVDIKMLKDNEKIIYEKNNQSNKRIKEGR
jgi:hypothetical protein